jgi:hypothetical protein
MPTSVNRALEWAKIDASDELLARLATYRHWLTTEAAAAGGIGPAGTLPYRCPPFGRFTTLCGSLGRPE